MNLCIQECQKFGTASQFFHPISVSDIAILAGVYNAGGEHVSNANYMFVLDALYSYFYPMD